jgi:hypothetical protein
VSGIDDSRDDEAEEANNKLDEGLKSCRAMVSSYRALLDKKRAKPADVETGEGPGDDGDAPVA